MDKCGSGPSHSCTFAKYATLFNTCFRDVVRRAEKPEGYDNTVATTRGDVSFAEVEKQSPAAAQLMNLCAFVPRDDIPRDMLVAGAQQLPQPLSSAVAATHAKGSSPN